MPGALVLMHFTTTLLAAALGLVFGSFVTALTYRLPRGESIAHGRSRCPKCAQSLSICDLVPIFSWIVHGGRCRHCAASISIRYPVIEVLSLALFITSALTIRDPWQLVVAMMAIPPLLALAVIDFEYQKVPDSLVAVLVPVAVAWRWLHDQDLLGGLIVAMAAFIVLVLLGQLFRGANGRSGLGLGDVKLMAVAAMAYSPFVFLVFLPLPGLRVLGSDFGGATGPVRTGFLWSCNRPCLVGVSGRAVRRRLFLMHPIPGSKMLWRHPRDRRYRRLLVPGYSRVRRRWSCCSSYC